MTKHLAKSVMLMSMALVMAGSSGVCTYASEIPDTSFIVDYEEDMTYKNDIVNIGLHFFLKNVRPYAASCNESQYCCRLTIGGRPPLAEQILRLFQQLTKYLQMRVFNCSTVIEVVS